MCSEFQEKLSAGFDGELTGGETALLLGHLAVCNDCKSHLEKLAKTHEALKVWTVEAPPLPPLPKPAVMVSEKKGWRQMLNWQRPGYALALSLFVFLGILLLHFVIQTPNQLKTKPIGKNHDVIVMDARLTGMQPNILR